MYPHIFLRLTEKPRNKEKIENSKKKKRNRKGEHQLPLDDYPSKVNLHSAPKPWNPRNLLVAISFGAQPISILF